MVHSLVGLAALVFVVAGNAGCVESSSAGAVGYIDVPLTAPGAGGVIYRLPPGTGLVLDNPSFSNLFGLKGDAPSQTLQVPVGDYSVSLVDAAGDTTVWPLTREHPDGTIETVPGMLELPSTVSVADHQTTSLVIRFHVAVIGPVTFELGSVEVSVEVDEIPTSSIDVVFAAPSLTASLVRVGETAPAALGPRLPAAGRIGDGYTISMHLEGPWSFVSSNTVCAPASASLSAAGDPGFIDLIAETPPVGGEPLCIEQTGPQQARLFMNVFRQGAATTPLLSDLGDHEYFFLHGVSAGVAADVFDGVTLHLRALSGTRPASVVVFSGIAAAVSTPDGGKAFDNWYLVDELGDATLSVTAH